MTAPALTYHTITLTTMTCSCGVTYALDEAYRAARQKDGKSWNCPNGCSRHYVETEETKLRAQLARTEGALTHAKWEAKYAEGRRRAEKAAKTKLKNRIAKGVCPCCNRHFANVQKHIAGQHPEFASDTSSGAEQ